jgi:hypothetical protein
MNWDQMMWEQRINACVKWIGEGETFGQVERTLARNGIPHDQIREIIQAVKDEISRRKKGNAAC